MTDLEKEIETVRSQIEKQKEMNLTKAQREYLRGYLNGLKFALNNSKKGQ